MKSPKRSRVNQPVSPPAPLTISAPAVASPMRPPPAHRPSPPAPRVGGWYRREVARGRQDAPTTEVVATGSLSLAAKPACAGWDAAPPQSAEADFVASRGEPLAAVSTAGAAAQPPARPQRQR